MSDQDGPRTYLPTDVEVPRVPMPIQELQVMSRGRLETDTAAIVEIMLQQNQASLDAGYAVPFVFVGDGIVMTSVSFIEYLERHRPPGGYPRA